MAASRAATTSLAGRAVHIKIHPRPRNLNESRQILRVLERFGEVSMYKNLRYDYQVSAPNTALAIYEHASSASNLLNASPIRFTLQEASAHAPTAQQQARASDVKDDGPGKPGAKEGLSGHAFTGPKRGSASTNVEKPERTDDSGLKRSAAHAPSAITPSLREFQVTAALSTFNHQAYIERQVHYGGYKVDLKSLVAEDLAASVPLLGLADILTRKVEVPVRIQNRRAEELARSKTLRQMWEEGMRGVRDSRGSD